MRAQASGRPVKLGVDGASVVSYGVRAKELKVWGGIHCPRSVDQLRSAGGLSMPRALPFYVSMLLSLTACSGGRSDDVGAECVSALECASGEVCLEGRCASASGEVLAEARVEGAQGIVEIETDRQCEQSESTRCLVPSGSELILHAPAIVGYRFAGWVGDERCTGSEPMLMLEVIDDVTCVARYVPIRRIAGVIQGSDALVAAASDAMFAACRTDEGACEVDEGSEVVLTAPRRDGFRLTGWQGEGCDQQDGYSVTVAAGSTDVTCTAIYQPALTVRGRVEGVGALAAASSASEGAQCASDLCAVSEGSTVLLGAPETMQGRFTGWTGHPQCVSSEPVITIADVQASVLCTANYVPRASVRGEARGTEATITASSQDAFSECAGDHCTLDEGGTVTLLAPSVAGYRFKNWTGQGCEKASGGSVTVSNATGELTCTANYVEGVSVVGSVLNAEGTVDARSAMPGAECEAGRCAIERGGSVTLTAPMLEDYTFVAWEGDEGCNSSEPTIVLDDVQSSITCGAKFAPRFVIAGKAAPDGAGTVVASSVDANARCMGASCKVDGGGAVELTASPKGVDYRFTGWSGGGPCSGSAPTLVVSKVGANQSCTANFVARVTVTVAPAPAAGGKVGVMASSAGAQCSGLVCTIDAGTDATLTAEAAQGHRFTGWTDCPASGTGTASLSRIARDTLCTANFERVYTVSAVGSPPEGGNLSVSVGLLGLPCLFNTCELSQAESATLTAQPNTGYIFDGWSGDCSGATPTVAINNPTRNARCTAVFKPMTYPVTVRSNDTRLGTASGPAEAPHNGSITLTATPRGSNLLVGWSCLGLAAGNTLVVSGITGPVDCIAMFEARFRVSLVSTSLFQCGSLTLSTPDGSCDLFGTYCDVRPGGSVTFTPVKADPDCVIRSPDCFEVSLWQNQTISNVDRDIVCSWWSQVEG
jgi:uncharacterized repeat protein (TIGR02543 family)